MRTEDEEDRGLSLSATKDEAPTGGAREDTAGSSLLSPSLSLSLSRSRSLFLFKLRVRSSIGPLLPPRALLWPLMWETGVLLRGLKEGATGDILTGGRPYSILSLQNVMCTEVTQWKSKIQTIIHTKNINYQVHAIFSVYIKL